MSDDAHPLLATLGLLAVGAGVLLVARPGLAATIGTDYAAVTLVAVLALVQCLRVVRARRASEVRTARIGDVETVESMPTPGEEFDRMVEEIHAVPRRVSIRRQDDVRETLEGAALAAIARRENCSRDRAREHVAAGTWTDDVHATVFLGGEGAPTPSLVDRLTVAASGHSPPQFRIRRTADAVARTAGVDDGSTVEGSGGRSTVEERGGRSASGERGEQ